MKQPINEIKRMQQLAGILNEGAIEELSPLVRNAAAVTAANRASSTDSKLAGSKANSQHSTFIQLPKELISKGEELAKKISDSVGATEYKCVLKKIVHDTNSEIPPFIHYKVETAKNKNDRIHTLNPFIIDVKKDGVEERQDNPYLSRDLSSAVMAFAKKLQIELQ